MLTGMSSLSCIRCIYKLQFDDFKEEKMSQKR